MAFVAKRPTCASFSPVITRGRTSRFPSRGSPASSRRRLDGRGEAGCGVRRDCGCVFRASVRRRSVTNRWCGRSIEMGTRAAACASPHRHGISPGHLLRAPRRTCVTVLATKPHAKSGTHDVPLPNDDRVSSSRKASSTSCSGNVFFAKTALLAFAAFAAPAFCPSTACVNATTTTDNRTIACSSLFVAHAAQGTDVTGGATSQANSQASNDDTKTGVSAPEKKDPKIGVDYPAVMSRAVSSRTMDFRSFLSGVRNECARKGVSAQTLASCFDQIEPYPEPAPKQTAPAETAESRKTEKDDAETHQKPKPKARRVQGYVTTMVSRDRVARGAELLLRHATLLKEVELTYGVPGEIIVAIWGIESSFGGFVGNTNAVEALANLSWRSLGEGNLHDAGYFKNELIDAVRIVDSGCFGMSETESETDTSLTGNRQLKPPLIGSWDGGLGQCQFMPSNYWRYAVDADGDGRADIWCSLPDTFASMGNFISKYCEWDARIKVPGFLVEIANETTLNTLRANDAIGTCWGERKQARPQTFFNWHGVVAKHNNETVSQNSGETHLLMPDGDAPDNVAFLATQNFRSLMRYNPSTQYAMAVSTLAREIFDEAALLRKANATETETEATDTAAGAGLETAKTTIDEVKA